MEAPQGDAASFLDKSPVLLNFQHLRFSPGEGTVIRLSSRIRHRSIVLVTALVVIHACASVSTIPAADAIAIVGVTVIDPSSSQRSAPDQTILVADGLIRAVGPSSAIVIPAGARRVDGRGKFAIP